MTSPPAVDDNHEDVRTAVVGPGRMGVGIAQVLATNGYPTALIDTKDRPPDEEWSALDAARGAIRSNLELLAEAGRSVGNPDHVLDRIRFTRSLEDGLDGVEWVFEAVPEDPNLKRALFEAAHPHLTDDAVLTTTTSSISIDTLSDAVADPSRLLITHWWNPPFIVPLVEVATTDYTDETAVDATVALLEDLGKTPVVCEDSPGFIGSRVQAAAMNEAIRIYEDGVASAEDIDRALMTGMGFRMPVLGVIEHVDLGGVDVLYRVNNYLNEELDTRFENPESVIEKMEADDLGPKTGRGYYDYTDVDVEALTNEKYRGMLAIYDAIYGADSDAE